ncbi:MAG: Crp/Fnr family transcriptional regulator [Xanthobacteraceae bacterium]|nr:MAG: Crp/Fnr family transcriptional regulator [Xanthobacteraceae bacterium]
MARMTPDDWQMIQRSALFSRLDEAIVREFLGRDPIHDCAKGEVICRQGEAADHYHIVLSGLVKLFRRPASGASAIIAIHGPSQAFMEAEALSGGVYTATAEAVSQARLLRISAHELRQRIEGDPDLALSMLGSASINLKMLLEYVEKLKTLTGPARLADFILSLTGPRSGAAELTLPYEKQLIAGQLGMTPESFSRALAQLRRHGVSVDRDRIEVKDIGRLQDYLASAH